jgi:RHS repeat-associated protein
VIAELDGTNQLIARYLHGDEFDQTFARISYGEPGASAPGVSPEVHWLLTDHLNSVRLVLYESGAVLDQIAYDAFGNIVAQLNPLLVNPILFASREFDAETSLYYNRARYLDPSTGRWTTQDPLGFAAGDANLYRYVGNNPVNMVDPSGLSGVGHHWVPVSVLTDPSISPWLSVDGRVPHGDGGVHRTNEPWALLRYLRRGYTRRVQQDRQGRIEPADQEEWQESDKSGPNGTIHRQPEKR